MGVLVLCILGIPMQGHDSQTLGTSAQLSQLTEICSGDRVWVSREILTFPNYPDVPWRLRQTDPMQEF